MFNVIGNTQKCRKCNKIKTIDDFYMVQFIDEERIMDQAVAGTMVLVEKLKGPKLYKTCKKCYKDAIIPNTTN